MIVQSIPDMGVNSEHINFIANAVGGLRVVGIGVYAGQDHGASATAGAAGGPWHQRASDAGSAGSSGRGDGLCDLRA